MGQRRGRAPSQTPGADLTSTSPGLPVLLSQPHAGTAAHAFGPSRGSLAVNGWCHGAEGSAKPPARPSSVGWGRWEERAGLAVPSRLLLLLPECGGSVA